MKESKSLLRLPVFILFTPLLSLYSNSVLPENPSPVNIDNSEIYEKQYTGFKVWLDCNQGGAIAFYYRLDKDTGNASRHRISFKKDKSVPDKCQPNSGKTYRVSLAGSTSIAIKNMRWDRGHLVPANHLDNSPLALRETFFVTNILPQNAYFNRSQGAWRYTETISECYREITPLSIWGGVIWGNDSSNDYFTNTHGIKTPDYWWKLIYRHDKKQYVAWIFPNNATASKSRIDEYLVSLKTLKSKLKFIPNLGVLERLPDTRTIPAKSWEVKRKGRHLLCENQLASIG